MLWELYGVVPWDVDRLTEGEIEQARKVVRDRNKKKG